MKQRIGIWVEGNEEVGFGHLVRMLVLARTLKRRFGARVFFYTERRSLAVAHIRRARFPVRPLPRTLRHKQAEVLASIARGDTITHLVIDLPTAITKSEVRMLRRTGAGIVLIDDLGSSRKAVDLCINAIDHMPYRTVARGHGRVLEGPQFMIMKPEFLRVKPAVIRKRGSRILLSFGGSDPANLTLWALKVLLPLNVSITSLLGPGYRFEGELKRFVAHHRKTVRIVKRSENLSGLFKKFDVVFTHFGITVYELARLGMPAALVHPTRYHNGVARVFAKHDSVLNLGFFREISAQTLRPRTLQLLRDWRARNNMSVKGRRIFDGNGVERVARRIVKTRAKT